MSATNVPAALWPYGHRLTALGAALCADQLAGKLQDRLACVDVRQGHPTRMIALMRPASAPHIDVRHAVVRQIFHGGDGRGFFRHVGDCLASLSLFWRWYRFLEFADRRAFAATSLAGAVRSASSNFRRFRSARSRSVMLCRSAIVFSKFILERSLSVRPS